jgi:hypothetical protein
MDRKSGGGLVLELDLEVSLAHAQESHVPAGEDGKATRLATF